MKVLILESCRSPEINKGTTESLILSRLFSENNIEYKLYSNDSIWKNPTLIDESLIRNLLKESSIDVVHFAVHGGEEGLILQWSNAVDLSKRVPVSVLTGSQISLLKQLRGKLIVSGACASAPFANDFLLAGANAVIAPLDAIAWPRLGLFFKTFYLSYRLSNSAQNALDTAVAEFPEYSCYRIFQN